MATFSECEVGVWPIKCLGLPLGGNPRKVDFWDSVVTKVSERLDGWKKGKGTILTLSFYHRNTFDPLVFFFLL